MLRPEQCFPPKAAVATYDQAEEKKKDKQPNTKPWKKERRENVPREMFCHHVGLLLCSAARQSWLKKWEEYAFFFT